MVEKITSDIKLGETHYSDVWRVRFDTGHGDTVELCHYEEAFAEGKEEGLGQGYDQGFAEGLVDGREEGIQTEYDRFWDAFQDYGDRSSYAFAFAGRSTWNKLTFRPKYDIVPGTGNTAEHMFREFSYAPGSGTVSVQERLTDLTEHLQNLGVRLDTSKVSSFGYMFQSSMLARVPELNMSMATSATSMFGYFGGTTIDKLIPTETCSWGSSFQGATKLVNIAFEGVIGQDINFQWSPLSVDSMKSVIAHLKNYAGTADAGKKTVKFTDACWTALEADSVAPDGNTWRDYVETTLGWLT